MLFVLQKLFDSNYDDKQFLDCMARTYEWQQHQMCDLADRKPFLAYYRVLKYLSPRSRQTSDEGHLSGSQQPDTTVQRQFMAWVQHWIDNKDFEQHVKPVWSMLFQIKRNWQHEAERNEAWDINFVDMNQPLSKQWEHDVPVQHIVAGSAVQPAQGQQSPTRSRAAEMQPSYEGLMTVASTQMQLPANLDFGEHGIHTGDGEDYADRFVQLAGQVLDNLQSPLSIASLHFLQQGAVPGQQGSMLGQQHAVLGQQGAVPGQQPGQQGSMPGQQGAVPNQQQMRYHADPGIIQAVQTSTDATGIQTPMLPIQVREAAVSIWLMHTFSTITHCALCVYCRRYISTSVSTYLCIVVSQHFWQTACHAQPTMYFMISEPTLYFKALLDIVQTGDSIAPQQTDIFSLQKLQETCWLDTANGRSNVMQPVMQCCIVCATLLWGITCKDQKQTWIVLINT